MSHLTKWEHDGTTDEHSDTRVERSQGVDPGAARQAREGDARLAGATGGRAQDEPVAIHAAQARPGARRAGDGAAGRRVTMTNQQLKDKIQAALEVSRTGGPAGEIDEITAALSHRGPSGAHHAGQVAAYRTDPQTLSRELPIALNLLENHPEPL